MAISQVAKGVYVISPNQVKKYKDTAAGEYTSVFTKERAEQWQMAQKQSLIELDLGTRAFAEDMKNYRDRIDALDVRQKELTRLKARVSEGSLDAYDAAAIVRVRESGSRQKTATDFALKKAEVLAISPGGESTVVTTGDGRSGKGPSLGSVSTDDEAEIEAALAESAGDPAAAAAAVKARRDSKSLGSATPDDTDAQNFKVVNDLADMRVGTTGEDIDTATDAILLELSQTDSQFAASHARVTAKQAQIESGSGGGSMTRTTTRPPDDTAKKRPGLDKAPAAPVVKGPDVASRLGLLNELDDASAAIQRDRDAIDRPSMAGFDYITRARDIAAGRFGPVRTSPAYGQRNAIEALLRADPSMRAAIIERYKSGPPGAALSRVEDLPENMEALKESNRTELPGAIDDVKFKAPSIPAITASEQAKKFLQDRERFSPVIEADLPPLRVGRPLSETPPSPPSIGDKPQDITPTSGLLSGLLSGVGASGGGGGSMDAGGLRTALPPIRPEAADLMTPQEIEEFSRSISPDVLAPSSSTIGNTLAAPFTPELAPFKDDPDFNPFAANSRRRQPGTITRAEAEADKRRKDFEDSFGNTPGGRVDTPLPEAPTAPEAPPAGRRTIPPQETPPAPKGPRSGPGQTKESYLLNRLEGAYELAKKADKLSRISASGPGKVAYDLYVANKAKGLPFSRTYEEITLTFAGNMATMEVAHEAALALDIKDRDTAPGGKG